jgi:long-chain fatty acid transport protein
MRGGPMVRQRNRILVASFLFCFICSFTTLVHAGGYAIPPQTAKAESMGGAATAGVDDPSAVYINPAALSFVDGNQVMAGLTYVNTISSVKNSGATSKNLHDDDFLPNFFGNYHIPDTKITLGIGSYAPFGLATSYQPDSFTRYAAIRSELRTMFVTPSVSWEPLPYLSVGGGVSFVHSSALLSRALFFGPFGDGKIRITDTANGYAYNLGLLVRPNDQLRFGLSYKSKVNLNFDSADVVFADASGAGGVVTRTKANGINIPLPPTINFGVHWQVNDDWGLEFQYDYVRWSQFEHLKANFPVPLPGLLGGFPITGFFLPQDWKDASTLRFGTSYKFAQNLEARAGFALEETPIPASTLGPVIPGADYLSLTAGLGYSWNRIKVDVGYMAVFYKNRRVNNNVLETGGNSNALPFPGVSGKDKYRIFQNLVGLHARYTF